MRLTPRLFIYPWQGAGNNCNSYCLAGEQLVLIDPGHVRDEIGEPCLEYLGRSMANDGLSLEDVDLILLTHSHPDHSEAAAAIKAKSKKGAKVAMHEAEEDHWLAMHRLLHPGRKVEPDRRLAADFFLNEGELLLGRDHPITLQVLHTPGHSPGSLTFYWPEEKALFTGDVIFAASVGRTDFPGGSSEQLKASIRRLAGLGVEYLLPGHMQVIRGSRSVKNNFDMVIDNYFMFF